MVVEEKRRDAIGIPRRRIGLTVGEPGPHPLEHALRRIGVPVRFGHHENREVERGRKIGDGRRSGHAVAPPAEERPGGSDLPGQDLPEFDRREPAEAGLAHE